MNKTVSDFLILRIMLACYFLTFFWPIKVNGQVAIEWQRSLGGSDIEFGSAIVLTPDSGYFVVGLSYSNDGDVTGHHFGQFISADCWVAKLNSSGTLLWQRSLGGSEYDRFMNVSGTIDGGFIACGYTESNDGDVSGFNGSPNYGDWWVVKMDSLASIEWQTCLGGSYVEEYF